MRCDACGATNPETATFCGQCHVRFAGPGRPSPQAPGASTPPGPGTPTQPHPGTPAQPGAGTPPPHAWGQVGAASGPGQPARDPVADLLASLDAMDAGTLGSAGPGATTPPAGRADQGHDHADHADHGHHHGAPTRDRPAVVGRFQAVGEEVGWRCAVCEEVNDVATFTCAVCGSRMDAEARSATDAVDWEGARRLEAALPGAGHLKAGVTGQGVARSALLAMWLLGALALATGGVGGLLAAIPLVLGIVLLYLTGPGDLDAHRRGRRPRLDARRLGFTVAGVTLGVIVFGALGLLL